MIKFLKITITGAARAREWTYPTRRCSEAASPSYAKRSDRRPLPTSARKDEPPAPGPRAGPPPFPPRGSRWTAGALIPGAGPRDGSGVGPPSTVPLAGVPKRGESDHEVARATLASRLKGCSKSKATLLGLTPLFGIPPCGDGGSRPAWHRPPSRR